MYYAYRFLQRLTDKYTLVQKAGSKAGKKDLRHAPNNEVSVRKKVSRHKTFSATVFFSVVTVKAFEHNSKYSLPISSSLHNIAEVLPVAGKVLANFLLIVPQQPVQSKYVAITDERQAVIDSVASWAIRCNIKEKPRVENQ